MLWYKAWCETRSRLGIAAVAVTAATGLVWHSDWQARGHERMFASYVWGAAGNDSVKAVFVLLAIVLGAGSLRQEQAMGTAGFTLALPVRRRQLVIARAAVGLCELCALAGFIGLLILSLSWSTWDPGAAAQTLRYVIQWSVCGGAVLALALLASIAIPSPYLGWLVSLLGFFGYEAIVGVSGLGRYPAFDLYRLMSDPRAPWLALVAVAVAGTALVALGHLWLRSRDFA